MTDLDLNKLDMLAKRLEAASVLVDAKHRPHWLQETIDEGAAALREARGEIERLDGVNDELGRSMNEAADWAARAKIAEARLARAEKVIEAGHKLSARMRLSGLMNVELAILNERLTAYDKDKP